MKLSLNRKLYGIFIMSLLFAGLLSALTGADDEKAEVTKLGHNLYKLRFGMINLVASVGLDGVLLSDTAFEGMSGEIKAELKKLGNDDVKIVINTHWHSDHTDGNKVFGKEAIIIAHRNVRKLLAEKQVLKYWGEEQDVLPEYARPHLTFSEKLMLHFNEEEIELIHFPGGHSDGDVIVHFKKAGVVHLGDLLFSDGFPAVDFENGGNTIIWADNLRKIIGMMPPDTKFVAGHGRDYPMEDLKEYQHMMESTVEIVRKDMEKGKNLEEMQDAGILKDWEAWGEAVFPCDKWIEMAYHSLKKNYLGQKPPGSTPEVFAPGIISTDAHEYSMTISKELDEIYFTRRAGEYSYICFTRSQGFKWSTPEITSFSGKFSDYDQCFHPEGDKLFFVSDRPLPGNPFIGDIWFVERSERLAGNWDEAKNIGSPVNTEVNEACPTVAQNGNLYFHAVYAEGESGADIYCAEYINGKYIKPKKLSNAINSTFGESNAFIAPDESYIIFCSQRHVGFGGGDLYISFRADSGEWSKAINMGDVINTSSSEYCPSVTPDGKYLFFTRIVGTNPRQGDIFWVSAEIIDQLKEDH